MEEVVHDADEPAVQEGADDVDRLRGSCNLAQVVSVTSGVAVEEQKAR
jgi:hypothetical protein